MSKGAATSEEQSPHSASVLKPVEFSTRGMDPASQFEVWRDHFSAVHQVEVERSCRHSFEATGRHWMLGSILFGVYETPARKVLRTRKQIAQDGLDHWFLRVFRSGRVRSRSENSEFILEPGQLSIGTYAHPYEEDQTADTWLVAIIPRNAILHLRDVIPEPRVLSGAPADCLADFLLSLGQRLPKANSAEMPQLSESLHSVVSACIPTYEKVEGVTTSGRDVLLRERVARIIAMHISSARLTPDRIAELAGVSRSSLYRAFEGRGGVAEYVSRLRLELVRRDLKSANLAEVPIYRIAERRGFYNVASFNRAFRSYFGQSPSEVRVASQHTTVSGLKDAPRASVPIHFIDLLRSEER